MHSPDAVLSVSNSLISELESLGLSISSLNELNDEYELQNLVENLKQVYYQDYGHTQSLRLRRNAEARSRVWDLDHCPSRMGCKSNTLTYKISISSLT
jgi:hypothetical protein